MYVVVPGRGRDDAGHHRTILTKKAIKGRSFALRFFQHLFDFGNGFALVIDREF